MISQDGSPAIAFGEFAPDQPSLGIGSIEARNVIPAARSYDPFPVFAAQSTTPLSDKCQGGGAFRSSTGVIGFYAGDGSKLYRLVGTVWTDASKVGGYSTDPAGRWVFVSFGTLVLATNGIDPIQKITIDGGTTFADLGGSPPVCRYLATCRDYVIACYLSTDVTAGQWCETNNPEGWSIGSGGGDIQPLPDTGQVNGAFGGDFFEILTERGLHRFDFVGGDIVFQRRQVGLGIGCSIPGTVQAFNDRAFFYHETGFYMQQSGGIPINISDQRVSKYFKDQLSAGARDFVFGGIDTTNSLAMFGFNTNGAADFPVTEILAYKWDAGPAGQWTHVIDGAAYDIIFSGLSAVNVTLEDLDVYGSLEAVPFPLDSPVWLGQGNQLFGAFLSGNSGWFNGGPMQATVTTLEAQLIIGQLSLVRGYRPLIESDAAVTVTCTLQARNLQSTSVLRSDTPRTANANGLVRGRLKGRYHRLQLVVGKTDGSEDFRHILGVDDVEYYPVGKRAGA